MLKKSIHVLLIGLVIAAICLGIAVFTNGDYRFLFWGNMIFFAAAGYLVKYGLNYPNLPMAILLLSLPYLIYYSTQVSITPWILLFPLLNALAVFIGYCLRPTRSGSISPKRYWSYLIGILLIGWFVMPHVSKLVSTEKVFEPGPEFVVKNLEGKLVKSTDLNDKILIIDFWATWCAPCIAEFKQLEKFQDAIEDKSDVQLLVVNEDEGGDIEMVNNFIAERPFDLPFYVDSLNTTYKAFKTKAFPALFIIDKAGNIRYRKSGFNPSEDLTSDLLSKIDEIRTE